MPEPNFSRRTTSPSLLRALERALAAATPGGPIFYRHTQAGGFDSHLGVSGGPGAGIGQDGQVAPTPEWIKVPPITLAPLPDAPDNQVDLALSDDVPCAGHGRLGVLRDGKVKSYRFEFASDGGDPKISQGGVHCPTFGKDETGVAMSILMDGSVLTLRLVNSAASEDATVLLLYEIDTF